MAFQPGLPGSQFPSEDALIRRIQDLERSVQQLAAANPFGPMGIKPVAGGIDVNGSMNVSGSMAVTGTLSLPAGIINNDALANPLNVGRTSGAATNFALTTTPQTFALATIPVPSGFTTALVFVVCTVGGINPNATSDFLYSSAIINGALSNEVFGYVSASGGSVAVTTAKSDILTGLSGGSVSVAVSIHTGAAWAANSANRAYVEAQAVFLR
jgi:hypothetical protein